MFLICDTLTVFSKVCLEFPSSSLTCAQHMANALYLAPDEGREKVRVREVCVMRVHVCMVFH